MTEGNVSAMRRHDWDGAKQVGIALGIDTGGTYTDAVLFEQGGEAAGHLVATAKSLTTKHDLALGIAAAIDAVLGAEPPEIDLVCVSTTLATNALVEGHGSRAGLFLIGFDRAALGRSGLGEALGDDPVAFIGGGHDAFGEEQAPLDLILAEAEARRMAPQVSAFAVAGYFAVRNPVHENALAAMLEAVTGLPVTCSHHLTANLDAPRRALTTLLNARLIPLLNDLVLSLEGLIAAREIAAPLMVVKGDGSLISAEAALARPIETILSGPAASVVGARLLSGEEDAIVSDIGGTTTDIAIVRGGAPLLDPGGARVGGWQTMVEAIAVHTVGLGGDSEVQVTREEGLRLGPQRVVPLSLLAERDPRIEALLGAQLETERVDPDLGRFALRNRRSYVGIETLKPAERDLWEALAEGPAALSKLGLDYARRRALERLRRRGLIALAGFTPSDAAHLLGLQSQWSRSGAELGAAVWVRRLQAEGIADPVDGQALARRTVEQLIRQTGQALVDAALAEAKAPAAGPHDRLARHLLGQALGSPDPAGSGLLRVAISLGVPLVGVGAPAAVYYPEVARRLGARLVLPDHGAVANAVGAVASGVIETVTALITAPAEGRFRVHLAEAVTDFASLEAAAAHGEAESARLARARALASGAGAVEVRVERRDSIVPMEGGRDSFVESRITSRAVGRPRIASA